ncbi:hypothetical protein BH09ACT8_BH09ACT8_45580 [soil metagenome]
MRAGSFAVDVVGVVFAIGLAQWLRFGALAENVMATYQYIDYAAVSVAIAAIWLAALSINRSRSPRIIGSGAEEYRRVLLVSEASRSCRCC